MLTQIAQRLVAYVLNDEVDADQRAVCEYGCELWLYTILSTAALLIVGTFLRFLLETAWMITVFYTCQSTGGGYHAATHTKCFLTMVVGLIVGWLLVIVPISHLAYMILLLIAAVVLWVLPLHLHPNKQYLVVTKKSLIRKSRWASLGIIIITMFLSLVKYDGLSQAGCIATALAAFSRLYASVTAYRQ